VNRNYWITIQDFIRNEKNRMAAFRPHKGYHHANIKGNINYILDFIAQQILIFMTFVSFWASNFFHRFVLAEEFW
jgi:hypothetical protein